MKSDMVGVVLVTFNRLDKLKIALSAYENQTIKPQYIVILNNNSTDGTSEYLNEWENITSEYKKYVITLHINTGGSGGFYEGLKKALELNAEWIFVADDDAYPALDAIEIADQVIKDKSIVRDDVAAICGTVLNHNEIDVIHRRRVFVKNYRVYEVPVPVDEYENKYFELQLFSYVGGIINKRALQKAGLTKKDYFIYYDDIEHAMRLQKQKKNICVPSIKIVHDSVESSQSDIVDWKYYYVYRNRLDFYKSHFSRMTYLFSYWKEVYKCYAHILTKRNSLEYKIRLEAAKDANSGKLGIHSIYKPGWKMKKGGALR